MTFLRSAALFSIVVAMLSACAHAPATRAGSAPPAVAGATPSTSGTPSTAAAAPPARSGRAAGYLSTAEIPGIPVPAPPPAPGSAAAALDEEVNRAHLALRDTPRWRLAVQDAVLTFPQVAQTFACALNAPINERDTPRLYTLMQRTLADAGRSTRQAKQLYQRARPFMVNGQPMCTPEREAALRRDGSYPSGHSAIGWALGLVLSEIAPEQATALLARGRAFGNSRLVCNVHWRSDVLEGQMAGAAIVARLHADPEFRADVEAARAEVAALRVKGEPVGGNCEAERQVLRE